MGLILINYSTLFTIRICFFNLSLKLEFSRAIPTKVAIGKCMFFSVDTDVFVITPKQT